VRRAARAVTQLYDGHLRGADIEGTQFALLSALASLGPCNQAAIGQRFALDKTTLSRNLKLLKNKGWIEMTAAADGRERRYVLTAAGEKRLAAARPAWRRAQEHLRASMTAKEWDAIWRLLHAMPAAAQTARRGMTEGSAR
jgi:DNA-binding MarR family transcriptional regulator